MDGIAMMLKAFGFDPETLKTTAADWIKTAQTTVDYFVKRHNSTDTTLARIEAKLDALAFDANVESMARYVPPPGVDTAGDADVGRPN